MKEQIKALIEKELPKHLGETFLERFTDLEKKEKDIELREKSLKDNELKNEYEHKLKDLKIEEANKRTELTKEITMGLVRNTNYRKTVYDNEMNNGGGHYDANNNWIAPPNIVKDYKEEITEE